MRTLKFCFDRGVTRRISTDVNINTYASLLENIKTLCPDIESASISVSWVDDEGDKIVVSSDWEVNEAVSFMQGHGKGYIKFNISETKPESPLCSNCHEMCSYPHFHCVSYPHIFLCDSCEKKMAPFSVSFDKIYTSDHLKLSRKTSLSEKFTSSYKMNPVTPSDCLSQTSLENASVNMSASYESVISTLTVSSTNSSSSKPMAKFIRHITYPDSSEVDGGSVFVKTWRIKNDGCDSWPSGCVLVNAGGDLLFPPTTLGVRVPVPSIPASHETDISIHLTAPRLMGRYQGYFRLQTGEGRWFGQRLWADIRVSANVSELSTCTEENEDNNLITPTLQDDGTDAVAKESKSAACTGFTLQQIMAMESRGYIGGLASTESSTTAPIPPTTTRPIKTIFLVCNHPSTRTLHQKVIETCGYQCVSCGDGQECISIVLDSWRDSDDHTSLPRNLPPIDLIVLDDMVSDVTRFSSLAYLSLIYISTIQILTVYYKAACDEWI